MNQIQELMEKRKLAWEGAKAFVEAKKDKDGLMSDEDAKTYSEMEKKVANFTKEIERMQSMENMEREMAKPMSEPLTSQPMQAENNNDKPKKTGRASNEYKEGVLQVVNIKSILQATNRLLHGLKKAAS